MNKTIFTATILTATLCLSAPAYPFGFGIYGSIGGGKTDVLSWSNDDYEVDYSYTHMYYGGGIIFESADEEDGIFHNRLDLGVEGMSVYAGRHDYRMLIKPGLVNTFAFRVAGNERVRFWIGPQIGFQLLTGLKQTTRRKTWGQARKDTLAVLMVLAPPATQLYGWYYLNRDPVWKRTIGAAVPVGLALGVNIAMTETAAFFIEGGVRCGLLALTGAGFNYEGYSHIGFIFGAI
ncbi:MAG: hypothetical protein JW807_04585 [Spirochaetes bacterium]|nr:hypothetical protein [Spirochaetota bacterium]